jgi:predicted MFS family arabinose efflux permease
VKLLERYAEVLRGRGTAGPLAASVVGRMALGMNSLAILLLVRESTGSYAAAGAVAALHALAFAVFGPRRARSADRRGPITVLRLTGVLHPLGLGALVLLAAYDAPAVLLALPAVLAGAAGPPLGAVMRALWPVRVSGPALVTAYALESVVVELCFVLGPLLTAGLAATLGPSAAVLAAGLLALVGALWLAATPAVQSVRPHPTPATSRLGPLSSAAVRALLLTVLAIGAGFGALEVALPAVVEEQGSRPAAAGVLLAVWSAGSIGGGLVYGALHLAVAQRRQLPVLVVALAVGSALPLLATGPPTMAVALFAYGMTIAPLFACNSVLLGEAAPPGTVTEAFAWNTSMIFGGAALGNAAAGVLAERVSPYSALLLTAGTGGVAAGLSVLGVLSLRRTAPTLT